MLTSVPPQPQWDPTSVHMPMMAIITYSANETKPSGPMLDRSTQAHVGLRLAT